MNQDLLTHLKDKSQGTLELLHSMDNFLFVIDLDGKVLLTSDSLISKTKMTKERLESKKFYELLKVEQTEKPLNFYDLLLLDKKHGDIDLLFYEEDGKPINTMLMSSSILSNFYNDKDYILVLLADMREHRQTQMQLMQSNKMVALGEMASGIAHEINNPLTVVMGQLNILKKHIERIEGDHSKIDVLTEKINTNFLRITKIVKSLQTMSRSSVKSPVEEVQLSEILDAVDDLSKPKFSASKVEFLTEGDFENVSIKCRETEIMQVMLNLVNNGIDSVAQSENPWVKVFFEENEEDISIFIMDSGGGIDMALQVRLFEPFYTTKEIGKGTGLGLSISKSLIEAHGGTLGYDTSKPNTCFKIVLPKN
mgnify:CR=1 FL=1